MKKSIENINRDGHIMINNFKMFTLMAKKSLLRKDIGMIMKWNILLKSYYFDMENKLNYNFYI